MGKIHYFAHFIFLLFSIHFDSYKLSSICLRIWTVKVLHFLIIKSFNLSGISTKDEVIKRHGVLTESIRTNVQLDESSSNIIYLVCDFERMDFEKVEDGDSGFFMREKSSNNEAFVEEIDEDITFYHFHHL